MLCYRRQSLIFRVGFERRQRFSYHAEVHPKDWHDIHVFNGLVSYALPTSDGHSWAGTGWSPIRSAIGEMRMGSLIYIFNPTDITEPSQLRHLSVPSKLSGSRIWQKFTDTLGRDSFATLAPRPFRWLMNIRPSYHIFQHSLYCMVKAYMPKRFARQFGHNQTYVGNPNPRLAYRGNMLDGTRAWYFTIVGCTLTSYFLPPQEPMLQYTLGFCRWYSAAN